VFSTNCWLWLSKDIGSVLKGCVKVCQRQLVNEVLGASCHGVRSQLGRGGRHTYSARLQCQRCLRVAHYGDPDPNSNARLWTSLFTGRPVGLLELYSFLPNGTHFVPGKQTLHFDV
jgi:hypothetical protein